VFEIRGATGGRPPLPPMAAAAWAAPTWKADRLRGDGGERACGVPCVDGASRPLPPGATAVGAPQRSCLFRSRGSKTVFQIRGTTGGRPPLPPMAAAAWAAPTWKADRLRGDGGERAWGVPCVGALPGRCPRGQRRWAPPSVRACFVREDPRRCSKSEEQPGGGHRCRRWRRQPGQPLHGRPIGCVVTGASVHAASHV